eukprot:tig00000601_g2286.t1
MTSNWYQTLSGSLDVGNNTKDFARIPSGSYVDVFLQNPVVIQVVQNAYATPKIYSYQLFFDPLSLSAEVIELLHESGLVKRETGYGPTVNRYPSSSNLPGTGTYQMRGLPLSYAADQPHFSTGASLCAELRECSISYAYGTDADSVPGARVMNIGGDITLFHG